ncbi:site-specific integrase [Streptomyces sp. RLB3-17]|nr:site-specific integrase [Streptomyces sp. RLA2-12]QDN60393.1 site-specific integrase [Streptomyces sp. S1D4-20]QDN70449.1 site-specific integrase [Streptomyces sp. S1D4-14]QDO01065.1 site-specific integrase [Streptomyces sp. RLB1-9]QDO22795.1 site-specific integrase [Streptomyces sp. S1A1-8]QDO32922.1 site-specific integrase [Streptomyces sp. S1A1-3]QDO42854.1 site-specific integrase [Streptomyces sp. RLB3-17]QDO52903.1 site-specific integrase [Streptomyces sp. RLB3-5]QDO63146.1 site-spe
MSDQSRFRSRSTSSTTTLPSSQPVCHRPTHRGAGVVHGVQVERATVRTTWTPWAASARLCLGRRQAGWEHPRARHCPPALANGAPAISEPERPRRRLVLAVAAFVQVSAQGASPRRARALGLRQGEVFGLAVEDVDFLGGVVHVVRQVKLLQRHRAVFAPPKGGKERDVHLPESVAFALAGHLKNFPATEITLPWKTLDGPPATAALLFTGSMGLALDRNRFNDRVWRPALRAVDVETGRDNGMHALRHFYASVLLDAGESIKALSEYLGHHDPGFTLRTYTHLMPSSGTRTRAAVDRVFRDGEPADDGPETAQGSE